jgi:hypothetical protein
MAILHARKGRADRNASNASKTFADDARSLSASDTPPDTPSPYADDLALARETAWHRLVDTEIFVADAIAEHHRGQPGELAQQVRDARELLARRQAEYNVLANISTEPAA